MTEPFLSPRLPELLLRTGEHVFLTGVSTLIATSIGLPLGIWAAQHPAPRTIITATVSILQTIPSLAMLALLLALLNRIGAAPAIVALVLYALLPIVRNTLTGLINVPTSAIEAANGIGMTAPQRLRLVEIPLALPVIIAGIRTAAVVGVGIATLSAFIGAGGLGQFINRGLSLDNHKLILLGAIPSALLALLVDASIGAVQWSLTSRTLHHSPHRTLWRSTFIALPFLLFTLGCLPLILPTTPHPGHSPDAPVIRIGSKNFTEQLILGEIMAQIIERNTSLRVDRRFDLGGTMICHQALLKGELDLYAEYTGTGLTAVLELPATPDPQTAYQIVSKEYANQFNLAWLEPFGFNNTYAITVRTDDAQKKNLSAISDLTPIAPTLRAGWTFEFSERPDGYPALQKRYGLHFGQTRDLETSLLYQSIARNEVDVICAFSTDGRIAAYKLTPLQDDLQLFPPYYAAPVVRNQTLQRHPQIRAALHQLAGKLTNPVMQRLNFLADQEKRRPAEIATSFLNQLSAPQETSPSE